MHAFSLYDTVDGVLDFCTCVCVCVLRYAHVGESCWIGVIRVQYQTRQRAINNAATYLISLLDCLAPFTAAYFVCVCSCVCGLNSGIPQPANISYVQWFVFAHLLWICGLNTNSPWWSPHASVVSGKRKKKNLSCVQTRVNGRGVFMRGNRMWEREYCSVLMWDLLRRTGQSSAWTDS